MPALEVIVVANYRHSGSKSETSNSGGFLLAIYLLPFLLFLKPDPKVIFKVREINIDTVNFKVNKFEKVDLNILMEARSVNGVTSINTADLKVKILMKLSGRYIKLTPKVYFNPSYSGNNKLELREIKNGEKIFFTIGLTCRQFYSLNKKYFNLNKQEKMMDLKRKFNKSILSIDDHHVYLDFDKVQKSYKGVYYPHDPEIPDSAYGRPVIIK